MLHAKGELPLNQPFRHLGILINVHAGSLVGKARVGGRHPEVSGTSWIHGFNTIVLDRDDSFTMGDNWPDCRRFTRTPTMDLPRHFSDRRKIGPGKIDPGRGDTLADGSPNDADRVGIRPTRLAFAEWEAAGLAAPNLEAMRRYRWERLTRHVVDHDYGAVLMFDPLNIRHATDSTTMQLWNTHNLFSAVLVCADG